MNDALPKAKNKTCSPFLFATAFAVAIVAECVLAIGVKAGLAESRPPVEGVALQALSKAMAYGATCETSKGVSTSIANFCGNKIRGTGLTTADEARDEIPSSR